MVEALFYLHSQAQDYEGIQGVSSMTEITVTTGKDGYMKIEAVGHTDSKLCAAISTLLQSSVNYLIDLEGQFPHELSIEVNHIDE